MTLVSLESIYLVTVLIQIQIDFKIANRVKLKIAQPQN